MKQHSSCTRRVLRPFAAALLIVASIAPARAQLVFSFSYGPGIAALFGSDPATATKITVGMSDAGAKWSSSLSDPVTLKIMVDLDPGLPSTAFAAAYAAKTSTLFTSVKVALTADSLSATDSSAVASLQPGPKIEAVTQDTSTAVVPSPEIRLGGATTGLWNTTLAVARPNLKALGLLSGSDGAAGADGLLTLNPAKIPTFDFTRGDGIGAGKFDFTGIAIHELGHLMGFYSGVDEVDYAGDGAPGNPTDLSGTAIFSATACTRSPRSASRSPARSMTGASARRPRPFCPSRISPSIRGPRTSRISPPARIMAMVRKRATSPAASPPSWPPAFRPAPSAISR